MAPEDRGPPPQPGDTTPAPRSDGPVQGRPVPKSAWRPPVRPATPPAAWPDGAPGCGCTPPTGPETDTPGPDSAYSGRPPGPPPQKVPTGAGTVPGISPDPGGGPAGSPPPPQWALERPLPPTGAPRAPGGPTGSPGGRGSYHSRTQHPLSRPAESSRYSGRRPGRSPASRPAPVPPATLDGTPHPNRCRHTGPHPPAPAPGTCFGPHRTAREGSAPQ